MNEQPYSLTLTRLDYTGNNGRIRVTLRQQGREIGLAEEWPYPGAARRLVIRVLVNFMPTLWRDGKIDDRVELNDAAARVMMAMSKRSRKGPYLGAFTNPEKMPAAFSLAAPGDVFMTYDESNGRGCLYRISWGRVNNSFSPFYHYCQLLFRGTIEDAEEALFRYAKVGACCAYPPVRKFWDWTPRGLSSVRFRLKPFEWLHCGYSWDNGEGTSWKRESYRSTWGGVEQVFASGGRDCDGRTSEGGECYADAQELAAVKPNDRYETPRPNWRYGRTECRDQYAEAANY